jgi:hypothetical protein
MSSLFCLTKNRHEREKKFLPVWVYWNAHGTGFGGRLSTNRRHSRNDEVARQKSQTRGENTETCYQSTL